MAVAPMAMDLVSLRENIGESLQLSVARSNDVRKSCESCEEDRRGSCEAFDLIDPSGWDRRLRGPLESSPGFQPRPRGYIRTGQKVVSLLKLAINISLAVQTLAFSE